MTERQAIYEFRCLLYGVRALLQMVREDYPTWSLPRERLGDILELLKSTDSFALTMPELKAWEAEKKLLRFPPSPP